ncbi:MAG TPA: PQQ-binding-like beta-propeller repeat protein, partial [Planctomycetota bacterium]|nr:PQQ-binding-like beta-propeller repeat protein [Planctomycetota bacterium]
SPVVHKGRVYVVHDNDERSWLAAFDAATGQEIFKIDREGEKSNWSTPFMWMNADRAELVTAGTGAVRSYDPDGKLLWSFRGMSSITIASPYASGGLLYISSGYVGDPSRPIYAIRPGAKGDITLDQGERSNEWIAWSIPDAAPYNPTTLVYDGHLYTLFDRGFLTCHDARTGAEVYGKQRLAIGANFTASPWAYGGKVFCLSEEGVTYVVRAGSTYELLHTNELDEMCMSTPAIARGSLFVRTLKKLHRIGKPAENEPAKER